MKTRDASNRDLRGDVKRFLDGFPGDVVCLRQLWYEGLEGCGTPSPTDLSDMRAVVESLDNWKPIGNLRHEKYGVQFTFRRAKPFATDNAKSLPVGAKKPNDLMVQHRFKLNSLQRAPDGRTFKVVVSEVYNLRCFEVVDGKMVGGMVKIHPTSDFAESLTEVTN